MGKCPIRGRYPRKQLPLPKVRQSRAGRPARKEKEMKKYQIWEQEQWGIESEGGMLINDIEIEDKVVAEGYSWYQIEDVSEDVDALVDKLDALYRVACESADEFEISDDEDLEQFLRDNGVSFDRVGFVPDYADTEEVLCWDGDEKCFFNLAGCDTYPTYKWWDGHNWKIEVAGESTTVTKVTVEDDYTDLDEWDGNNWTCGGTGLHQRYYKVLELDGEQVEDMYLLVRWSQWQGSHDTGEIMTKEQLDRHIAELHC
jgi:hypothetical protein